MRFTLLRHGRSLADDQGVHEGRYDSPLTEVGREQVRRLAAYWQAQPPGFDRAYTSTLGRALDTARIIGAGLGLEPVPSDLRREFDNGPLAGLTFTERQRRYPRPAFRHDLDTLTPDGGESQAAFRARALHALAFIWAGGGEHALVVSHGGMLNALLRELTGATRATFAFGDTAFATVQLSADHSTARLSGVNLQPHLFPA